MIAHDPGAMCNSLEELFTNEQLGSADLAPEVRDLFFGEALDSQIMFRG
jgi:hypothetical protein